MNETVTYILWHYGPSGDIKPFYVGESQDPAARFKQHQRDASNPLHSKEAYEYLRTHNVDEFFYDTFPGVTEAELVRKLTIEGFKLYNSNKGINSTAKKRKNFDFVKANREAEERIERRQVLHGPAQQLSKSDIVQRRILGVYPTLDDLLAAEWRECPGEMLGAEVGRTAQRAEYTRVGDVGVYVAYKDKDRHLSVMARDREGRECRLPSYRWYGPKALKETLLRNLVLEMNQPWGWVKPYAS